MSSKWLQLIGITVFLIYSNSCDWTGIQQDYANHMRDSHSNNGEFFPYYYSSTLEFSPDKTCKEFNLIDAFNKKFVFLYVSHEKNPNVILVIYLLGRKCDAEKYMVDFELKDGLRKIKFIETCFSDAQDIKTIISDHRCLILPKKMVETFVKNGRLEYRFRLKRKEGLEAENHEKKQHLMNSVLRVGSQTPPPSFNPTFQMKSYQSESNLILTAQRRENGHAPTNNKPKYRRAAKKWIRILFGRTCINFNTIIDAFLMLLFIL